jgi:hypothetical protein
MPESDLKDPELHALAVEMLEVLQDAEAFVRSSNTPMVLRHMILFDARYHKAKAVLVRAEAML